MAVSTSSSSSVDRNLFPILSISFISVLLLLSAISVLTSSILSPAPNPSYSSLFLLRRSPRHLPSFASLITGSSGDSTQILRLLLALYPSRNCYLLHLPPDASNSKRTLLALVHAALPHGRRRCHHPLIIVIVVIIISSSSSSSSSPHHHRRQLYHPLIIFIILLIINHHHHQILPPPKPPLHLISNTKKKEEKERKNTLTPLP